MRWQGERGATETQAPAHASPSPSETYISEQQEDDEGMAGFQQKRLTTTCVTPIGAAPQRFMPYMNVQQEHTESCDVPLVCRGPAQDQADASERMT